MQQVKVFAVGELSMQQMFYATIENFTQRLKVFMQQVKILCNQGTLFAT